MNSTTRNGNEGTDTDHIVKVRLPKNIVAWRGFVTVLLLWIGGGGQNLIGDRTLPPAAASQLERINVTLSELQRDVALLRQSSEQNNRDQVKSQTDHENRLRSIEQRRTP